MPRTRPLPRPDAAVLDHLIALSEAESASRLHRLVAAAAASPAFPLRVWVARAGAGAGVLAVIALYVLAVLQLANP